MKKKDIVIAGYSETKLAVKTGRTAYDLAGEALASLLASAGIKKSAIDGFAIAMPLSEAPNPFFAPLMCDALGLTPRWLQLGGMGGASTIANVQRAAHAIRDGMCRLAVVMGADAPSTRMAANYGGYRGEFLEPTGIQGPPGMFGLLLNRYASQHELKMEALGKIALTQREHALMNENTLEKFRKPLTMNEYVNSRMVSEPLRLLDSVMFCDGANAVLVTSAEYAKELGLEKVVFPVAYSEVTNFNCDQATPDITLSGFSLVGPEALKKAGMTPKDIRMVHPYDDFTIAVMMTLEQIGFCGTGRGSDFILDTDISYRGTLPLNTGGGQISCGQPGLASGGLNLVEAVRQMFGEAGERQVKDVSNALVTGIGVIAYARNWVVSNVMILEA